MYEANVDALTGEIGTPRAVRTTNKKKRREKKRTEENGPVPCFCFRFSVCARAVLNEVLSWPRKTQDKLMKIGAGFCLGTADSRHDKAADDC
jgi:hypothetical protein